MPPAPYTYLEVIAVTDRILKFILFALAVMNILDYAFTLRAVYVLGATEANPIMAATMGTPAFAVIKLLIVPALCYLLWCVRHMWSRPAIRGLLLFVFAAYSGVTAWHVYGQLL